MIMELSEQSEARRSWLKVAWVPRHQSEEADALTNGEFGGFREELRVHIDPKMVDWVILDKMLEFGGGLVEEIVEEDLLKKKEERRASKAAKKRRKADGDSLREGPVMGSRWAATGQDAQHTVDDGTAQELASK